MRDVYRSDIVSTRCRYLLMSYFTCSRLLFTTIFKSIVSTHYPTRIAPLRIARSSIDLIYSNRYNDIHHIICYITTSICMSTFILIIDKFWGSIFVEIVFPCFLNYFKYQYDLHKCSFKEFSLSVENGHAMLYTWLFSMLTVNLVIKAYRDVA